MLEGNLLANPNHSEQGKISKFLETCQINDTQKKKLKKKPKGSQKRKERVTTSKFREIHTKVNSILKHWHSKESKTTPLISRTNKSGHQFVSKLMSRMNNENVALTAFHSSVLSPTFVPNYGDVAFFVKEESYITASLDSVLTCDCYGTSVSFNTKYYFHIIGQRTLKPCELGYFAVYTISRRAGRRTILANLISGFSIQYGVPRETQLF